MLRLSQPQLELWDALLPDGVGDLTPELAAIDRLLDDERFMAPFLARSQRKIGRPTIPMEQYLRLMVLKHRYNLGYEPLVSEVADSIKWRRFCRIGLAQPVPHSTTLSRLTRRFGEAAVRELQSRALTSSEWERAGL